MSYAATTDFLALLRQTSGGMRIARMPGLDWLVPALARAGLLNVVVAQTAPTVNQPTTAWFRQSSPSYALEGALYLWNASTATYELATTTLWAQLFAASAGANTQIVTTPGPVNVLAASNVVLVNQTVAAPITLIMPPAAGKIGDVLISDWKGDAYTNNITVTLSGSEVFPGGGASWTIASDTGSILLRPVVGMGYAL